MSKPSEKAQVLAFLGLCALITFWIVFIYWESPLAFGLFIFAPTGFLVLMFVAFIREMIEDVVDLVKRNRK